MPPGRCSVRASSLTARPLPAAGCSQALLCTRAASLSLLTLLPPAPWSAKRARGAHARFNPPKRFDPTRALCALYLYILILDAVQTREGPVVQVEGWKGECCRIKPG